MSVVIDGYTLIQSPPPPNINFPFKWPFDNNGVQASEGQPTRRDPINFIPSSFEMSNMPDPSAVEDDPTRAPALVYNGSLTPTVKKFKRLTLDKRWPSLPTTRSFQYRNVISYNCDPGRVEIYAPIDFKNTATLDRPLDIPNPNYDPVTDETITDNQPVFDGSGNIVTEEIIVGEDVNGNPIIENVPVFQNVVIQQPNPNYDPYEFDWWNKERNELLTSVKCTDITTPNRPRFLDFITLTKEPGDSLSLYNQCTGKWTMIPTGYLKYVDTWSSAATSDVKPHTDAMILVNYDLTESPSRPISEIYLWINDLEYVINFKYETETTLGRKHSSAFSMTEWQNWDRPRDWIMLRHANAPIPPPASRYTQAQLLEGSGKSAPTW
jgi:hypothetical protein